MRVNNLKILFITHYSGMYGANQSLCTLILELRNNYNVRPVVLLRNEGPVCNFLRQNSINYHVIHFYWWVNSDQGFFQKALNLRKQFRNHFIEKKVEKIIHNENIDLLYSNSITVNLGAVLHNKLKIPHIWHIRENLASYDLKFSLGDKISVKIIRKGADRFIVISNYLLVVYKNLFLEGLVIRIYNGIPLDSFTSITNNIKRDTSNINLCLSGIVCDQKNQMDALMAIRILVKEKGYTNIRLHLIGGAKEDYLKKVSEYIDLERLKDNILYHGHQDDVHDLLSRMDIGLMCARDEAFGRVTVEYMLHRLPVIASNSGANPELVIPGISGDLYELNNPFDLACKIEKYLFKPELIEKTGTIAYEFAKTNFSSEKNTREIYRVIEDVMKDDNQ